MDDDLRIPQIDQERIEGMVAQYRHQIENLYKIAYLQGSIEQSQNDLAKLKAEAT